MNRLGKAGRMLLFAAVLCIGLVWSGVSFGAGIQPLAAGKKVQIYPLKDGDITVFEEADQKTKKETVPGAKLLITLSREEGNSLYGTYKVGSEKHAGWFAKKALLADPDYPRTDAIIRYKVDYYPTVTGKALCKLPAYTSMDILGQAGAWYQMTYEYKSGKWRIGWIRKADYNKSVRIYDEQERRPMADGLYTLCPKGSPAMSVTVSGTALQLAAAASAKTQQFTLQFVGDNCYRLFSKQTKQVLAAEQSDGSYTGKVVMAAASGEPALSELWQMKRSGAYYVMKNMGTDQYLVADEAGFFLIKKTSSAMARFRISMSGGKNKKHWQVFSQYDPEWGAKKYGKYNTMAASACGILSQVNAIYALNGQYVDPMALAAFAVKKGYRVEHAGTDSKIFKAVAAKYGKAYGFAFAGSTTSLSVLKKHLTSGGTAVAYVPGHYMAVGDYKGGKYLALDSYATTKRKTSSFGCWISGSRFKSGSLRAKNFFLLKAIP